MLEPNLFLRISSLFEQTGISYMLTGSFASTVYGMARCSPDVDFLIAADEDQTGNLISLFPKLGFYSGLHGALEACRRKLISMQSIILLVSKLISFSQGAEFQSGRVSSSQRSSSGGTAFYIESPEDVIVAKLEWAKMGASLRQIEDVVGILKVQQNALDRPYIDKWVRELGLDSEWTKARQFAGLE